MGLRFYVKNPLESRSMDTLMGAVGGGRGGRGGRGRKKGGKKQLKRKDEKLVLGSGKDNIRWGGFSHPLSATPTARYRYGTSWLKNDNFGIHRLEESEETPYEGSVLELRQVEGPAPRPKIYTRFGWTRKGWTGRSWNGRCVGPPELPNGTVRTDFSSVVIEMKRVANQTRAGKKRTVSCLVVIGNGNGVAGFAVGRGEEMLTAIRKAKNRAVNSLQFIPRYDNRTIYHNVKVKYCRTNIHMERKVPGSGLRCQRVVRAICDLVGIKDMRAKIIGSTNPLNIVRATMKGLTKQETHQSLADQEERFVVEFREECDRRPVVSSVPRSLQTDDTISALKDMQLVHA